VDDRQSAAAFWTTEGSLYTPDPSTPLVPELVHRRCRKVVDPYYHTLATLPAA
jgi:hypothetical protein